jgi:hypothetical protein
VRLGGRQTVALGVLVRACGAHGELPGRFVAREAQDVDAPLVVDDVDAVVGDPGEAAEVEPLTGTR